LKMKPEASHPGTKRLDNMRSCIPFQNNSSMIPHLSEVS